MFMITLYRSNRRVSRFKPCDQGLGDLTSDSTRKQPPTHTFFGLVIRDEPKESKEEDVACYSARQREPAAAILGHKVFDWFDWRTITDLGALIKVESPPLFLVVCRRCILPVLLSILDWLRITALKSLWSNVNQWEQINNKLSSPNPLGQDVFNFRLVALVVVLFLVIFCCHCCFSSFVGSTVSGCLGWLFLLLLLFCFVLFRFLLPDQPLYRYRLVGVVVLLFRS